MVNSKTTFVTVNQNKDKDIEELNDYSKTTFVTVNPLLRGLFVAMANNSKTTFVTVNPSFLKALYFII